MGNKGWKSTPPKQGEEPVSSSCVGLHRLDEALTTNTGMILAMYNLMVEKGVISEEDIVRHTAAAVGQVKETRRKIQDMNEMMHRRRRNEKVN